MRSVADSMIRGAGAAIAIALALALGCSPGPSQGSAGDAAADDAAALDGGPLDAALVGDAPLAEGGPDGGGCHPINITGFQPPTTLPMGARSTACNGFNGDGGLVESYRDACLQHTAGFPPCVALLAGEAPTAGDAGDAGGASDCLNCLLSEPTPELTYSSVTARLETIDFVNYPLCIELVDPSDAGLACALLLETLVACELYACQGGCPVTDEDSVAAYNECSNEANLGACSGYLLELNACLAAELGDGDTPVAQTCFFGTSPQLKYVPFAHYLCGGD